MTQRDMAGYLDIDVKTLRNWRNKKPNLYKTIMKGFASDAVLRQTKENYEKLSEVVEVSYLGKM